MVGFLYLSFPGRRRGRGGGRNFKVREYSGCPAGRAMMIDRSSSAFAAGLDLLRAIALADVALGS